MLPIFISYHLQSSSLVIDKYVASAIGDGQRRLQMIANKNEGHID
jgi:hypothetical protein